MIIGIDFDGTIVKHRYPIVGPTIDESIEVMKELQEAGHKLILYTMRSGDELQDAVAFLKENGIDLYGVNNNPGQYEWTKSPKVYCHIYIDDAALGCPLEFGAIKERPWVDWGRVREMLVKRGVL